MELIENVDYDLPHQGARDSHLTVVSEVISSLADISEDIPGRDLEVYRIIEAIYMAVPVPHMRRQFLWAVSNPQRLIGWEEMARETGRSRQRHEREYVECLREVSRYSKSTAIAIDKSHVAVGIRKTESI